jgi:uncharacterized membrane protein
LPDIEPSNARDLSSELTITHVVYGLLALGLLVAYTTAVIGVIVNYVKLDDVRGTWLESHFRWQIRTFWFGLIWLIIGWVLFMTIIGIPLGLIVWAAAAIWVIYRIVKGWLKLADRKPLVAQTKTTESAPAA